MATLSTHFNEQGGPYPTPFSTYSDGGSGAGRQIAARGGLPFISPFPQLDGRRPNSAPRDLVVKSVMDAELIRTIEDFRIHTPILYLRSMEKQEYALNRILPLNKTGSITRTDIQIYRLHMDPHAPVPKGTFGVARTQGYRIEQSTHTWSNFASAVETENDALTDPRGQMIIESKMVQAVKNLWMNLTVIRMSVLFEAAKMPVIITHDELRSESSIWERILDFVHNYGALTRTRNAYIGVINYVFSIRKKTGATKDIDLVLIPSVIRELLTSDPDLLNRSIVGSLSAVIRELGAEAFVKFGAYPAAVVDPMVFANVRDTTDHATRIGVVGEYYCSRGLTLLDRAIAILDFRSANLDPVALSPLKMVLHDWRFAQDGELSEIYDEMAINHAMYARENMIELTRLAPGLYHGYPEQVAIDGHIALLHDALGQQKSQPEKITHYYQQHPAWTPNDYFLQVARANAATYNARFSRSHPNFVHDIAAALQLLEGATGPTLDPGFVVDTFGDIYATNFAGQAAANVAADTIDSIFIPRYIPSVDGADVYAAVRAPNGLFTGYGTIAHLRAMANRGLASVDPSHIRNHGILISGWKAIEHYFGGLIDIFTSNLLFDSHLAESARTVQLFHDTAASKIEKIVALAHMLFTAHPGRMIVAMAFRGDQTWVQIPTADIVLEIDNFANALEYFTRQYGEVVGRALTNCPGSRYLLNTLEQQPWFDRVHGLALMYTAINRDAIHKIQLNGLVTTDEYELIRPAMRFQMSSLLFTSNNVGFTMVNDVIGRSDQSSVGDKTIWLFEQASACGVTEPENVTPMHFLAYSGIIDGGGVSFIRPPFWNNAMITNTRGKRYQVQRAFDLEALDSYRNDLISIGGPHTWPDAENARLMQEIRSLTGSIASMGYRSDITYSLSGPSMFYLAMVLNSARMILRDDASISDLILQNLNTTDERAALHCFQGFTLAYDRKTGLISHQAALSSGHLSGVVPNSKEAFAARTTFDQCHGGKTSVFLPSDIAAFA